MNDITAKLAEALRRCEACTTNDAVGRQARAALAEYEATPAQAQQAEPVAWIDNSGHPHHLSYVQGHQERRLYGPLRPLYTHPPKTEAEPLPILGAADWMAQQKQEPRNG